MNKQSLFCSASSTPSRSGGQTLIMRKEQDSEDIVTAGNGHLPYLLDCKPHVSSAKNYCKLHLYWC